jgi:hypothetical protein
VGTLSSLLLSLHSPELILLVKESHHLLDTAGLISRGHWKLNEIPLLSSQDEVLGRNAQDFVMPQSVLNLFPWLPHKYLVPGHSELSDSFPFSLLLCSIVHISNIEWQLNLWPCTLPPFCSLLQWHSKNPRKWLDITSNSICPKLNSSSFDMFKANDSFHLSLLYTSQNYSCFFPVF